jgi:hypothetical protein
MQNTMPDWTQDRALTPKQYNVLRKQLQVLRNASFERRDRWSVEMQLLWELNEMRQAIFDAINNIHMEGNLNPTTLSTLKMISERKPIDP